MTHTKDEAFLEWYKNAHWGNEDFKECCRRSWNAAINLAAQPAPVQPVGTYGEIFESMLSLLRTGLQRDQQIYMEMKDKPLYTTPPAQPAVPDAFGTREGEHPQYIEGWNDCRAEMLKGMKP
jgi:hypothetical protein